MTDGVKKIQELLADNYMEMNKLILMKLDILVIINNSGSIMLFVQAQKEELEIANIMIGEIMTVIHKLNVYNYIALEVDHILPEEQ